MHCVWDSIKFQPTTTGQHLQHWIKISIWSPLHQPSLQYLHGGQRNSFDGTSVEAVHALLSENSCLLRQPGTWCPTWIYPSHREVWPDPWPNPLPLYDTEVSAWNTWIRSKQTQPHWRTGRSCNCKRKKLRSNPASIAMPKDHTMKSILPEWRDALPPAVQKTYHLCCWGYGHHSGTWLLSSYRSCTALCCSLLWLNVLLAGNCGQRYWKPSHWRGCNNPTSNCPYQDHEVPYNNEDRRPLASIVARLSPLNTCSWSAKCHSKVVMNTAQLTHRRPWGYSQGSHSKVSGGSWFLLSDMNGQISSTTAHLNQLPTVEIMDLKLILSTWQCHRDSVIRLYVTGSSYERTLLV